MLNLLLRYVTLTKSISDSIATDQFSTYVHQDSSASKSIGSFRDSEDSFLDLISITDDVHDKLEDIDEIIADNDEEGGQDHSHQQVTKLQKMGNDKAKIKPKMKNYNIRPHMLGKLGWLSRRKRISRLSQKQKKLQMNIDLLEKNKGSTAFPTYIENNFLF